VKLKGVLNIIISFEGTTQTHKKQCVSSSNKSVYDNSML